MGSGRPDGTLPYHRSLVLPHHQTHDIGDLMTSLRADEKTTRSESGAQSWYRSSDRRPLWRSGTTPTLSRPTSERGG